MPRSCELSIVLVARNEETTIEMCIRSVLAAMNGLDAEVCLVDSASQDRTASIAQGMGIRVLSVPPDADPSAALSRSVGARHCSGRYIQFVDGDMTLDSAWLRTALDYLAAAGSRVAAVAGEIRQNRTADPHCEYRRRNLAKMTRTREPRELKSPYGAFMIRADVLREVGSFDPGLKAGEEGELADRMRAAGYRIMLLPHLACLHHVTDGGSLLHTLGSELRDYVSAGQFFRRSLRNGAGLFRLWQFKFCLLGAPLAVCGVIGFAAAGVSSRVWPGIVWLGIMALVSAALFVREERRITHVFYYLVVCLTSWLFFLRGFFRPVREHGRPEGP